MGRKESNQTNKQTNIWFDTLAMEWYIKYI